VFYPRRCRASATKCQPQPSLDQVERWIIFTPTGRTNEMNTRIKRPKRSEIIRTNGTRPNKRINSSSVRFPFVRRFVPITTGRPDFFDYTRARVHNRRRKNVAFVCVAPKNINTAAEFIFISKPFRANAAPLEKFAFITLNYFRLKRLLVPARANVRTRACLVSVPSLRLGFLPYRK